MLAANLTTIHYNGDYNADFRHSIMYDNTILSVRKQVKRHLVSQSYITIALGEDCSNHHTQFMIVFNYGSWSKSDAAAFSIDNYRIRRMLCLLYGNVSKI